MRSIRYPNAVADLVVLGFRGPRRIGFTVRPLFGGLYRILVWPASMADPDLVRHAVLEFLGPEGPPAHASVDLSDEQVGSFPRWEWALVASEPDAPMLQDLRRAAFEGEAAARGSFSLSSTVGASETRAVAWSCHMPFETAEDGRAILGEESEGILEWYASLVETFKPHVVWGAGDTAYSDGSDAVDFS